MPCIVAIQQPCASLCGYNIKSTTRGEYESFTSAAPLAGGGLLKPSLPFS